jgi:predicted amidohydrolase
MRVALYQCRSRPIEVAANLDRLAAAADTAAQQGADLLLTPEMFLTGYDIGVDAVRRLAQPRDGDSARVVAEIARRAGLAVVYGYPERPAVRDGEDGDRADGGADVVFNAVQLIDSGGAALANYRKTHLFGELDASMFSASPLPSPLVDLDGWRLGMLICYDVEFPENARRLALAGADLILAPTANMVPYEVVATTTVPARAYENQIYLAYANYCGFEGRLEYCGLSCVAAPDGTVAARAGQDETVLVAELDRDLLDASRRLNTYLADRRPELY